MKYRLIQYVAGQWIRTEFSEENVLPAMEVRGFKQNGVCRNAGVREELQGAPRFTGLNGPFWDGDAIRYECREAYNQLSV